MSFLLVSLMNLIATFIAFRSLVKARAISIARPKMSYGEAIDADKEIAYCSESAFIIVLFAAFINFLIAVAYGAVPPAWP